MPSARFMTKPEMGACLHCRGFGIAVKEFEMAIWWVEEDGPHVRQWCVLAC